MFADGAHTGTNWGQFANSNGSMYVNGVKVDYASGDNVNDLLIKINAKADLTGVTASTTQLRRGSISRARSMALRQRSRSLKAQHSLDEV